VGPVRTGRVRWYESSATMSFRCSLRTRPVCTGRIWCEAVERPVLLFQARVRLAIGGNGRVQTASDTWLFLEHWC